MRDQPLTQVDNLFNRIRWLVFNNLFSPIRVLKFNCSSTFYVDTNKLLIHPPM